MAVPEQFATDVIRLLEEPIDSDRVASRKERGDTLVYLETWEVIQTANKIFGFDGWTYSTIKIQAEPHGYMAIVQVKAGGVSRSDVGYCSFAVREGSEPRGSHIETAIKGAVSDGLKRALRSFGDQFGNSLYDKENEERQEAASTRPKQGATPRGRTQQAPAQTQQLPDYYKDLTVDDQGTEILRGRALRFFEYVQRHEVDWQEFLEQILQCQTLKAYYDTGGSPRGALDAFRQYLSDMGIEEQS